MGMGRRRSRSRAGWPPNLYPNRNGYKYRRPDTGREVWMGTDRARAFEAARKLNAILTPANDLVDRVVQPTETIAAAVAIFRRDVVPGMRWGEKTALGYEQTLSRIERLIGDREAATFTVRDASAFLRETTESPRGRQNLRLVLSWVFATAVEEGWLDTNPVLQTRKAHFERQRERLTPDAYEAIWTEAEPWLQNAMDLSLVTLLRREDIALLRFADIHGGCLHVVPGKTESSTGVRLRIAVEGELAEILARCRDAIASPYVIHRLPGKARPHGMRAKARDHHTQVLPEQLSRAFAAARDRAARHVPDLFGPSPPTFHEIRSLGAARLRQRGWTEEQVQALLAHSDLKTTRTYLADHEPPWLDIRIG